jgi:branched-chain amino acid transport system permease protein
MSAWYDANLVLIQSTFIGLLLALSIQFPLRMGVFSFAGVGSYAIGAYGAAIITIREGWPAIATIVVVSLGCGVIGFLLALLVQRLNGLYLGMATIAFDLIISVIVTNGGDLTGGPTGLFGAISNITMTHVVVITVIALGLLALTERGSVGRRIEAVRDDPELATSMGVNVRRYRRLAFVVSGILGGCSGAFNALLRTTVGPTDIGFGLVVLALTMIIVGGARSWLGALIGAVIFTWLPDVLTVVGEWQTIIYSTIVALAAIWAPGGLLGLATEFYRNREQRRRIKRVRAELAKTRPEPEPEPDLQVLAGLTADVGVEQS